MLPLKGVCPFRLNERITSFNANRLVLISAPSIRVCLELLPASAAFSLPARSIKLNFPNLPNPVHLYGKVIWSKRLSLEDGVPYDIGIEFTKVEEDNKNTFLKLLCDLIYAQARKISTSSGE